MKTLVILFFYCLAFTSLAQGEKQQEYLVTYGQVWGFLKYFHPQPSTQDWDKKILDDFESVKSCSSDSAFNGIISSLINDCGSFPPEKRIIADSLKYGESFEWLETKIITVENKKILIHLLQNKPNFENKYIKEDTAGNPMIMNESAYDSYAYNPAIQFLALTRYWNIINYFCPYRDIIPRNWTTVYKDHLANFVNANTYEDYYFAVRKITSEIRDGHGFIETANDPMSNYKYAPYYCMNVNEGFFITYIWQDSVNSYNLKRMDRIVSINGISIEEKIKQIGTIVSTSNDYNLSKYTHYLRIFDADSVSITVERDGELIHVDLPTLSEEILMQRNKSKKQMNPPSAYGFHADSISGMNYCSINMGILKQADITRKFKRKLYKTDHLIIDSRNYPNWTIIKLSEVLIKGERKFADFKKINFAYPGSYEWTQSQTIGNNKKGYQGTIYVLVDFHTMSQAEYTVMALQQHPNTIVIGGQTAGADGNVSRIQLPFGITSAFSGLGVFYPDGSPTQQVGVRRDYEIVQNISYLEEQKDVILEKALELMRQKNASNAR